MIIENPNVDEWSQRTGATIAANVGQLWIGPTDNPAQFFERLVNWAGLNGISSLINWWSQLTRSKELHEDYKGWSQAWEHVLLNYS
jgi:hypothetical protein